MIVTAPMACLVRAKFCLLSVAELLLRNGGIRNRLSAACTRPSAPRTWPVGKLIKKFSIDLQNLHANSAKTIGVTRTSVDPISGKHSVCLETLYASNGLICRQPQPPHRLSCDRMLRIAHGGTCLRNRLRTGRFRRWARPPFVKGGRACPTTSLGRNEG